MSDDYIIEWSGHRSDIRQHDDNVDVYVTFQDGRCYTATFFTLQNLSTLLSRYKASGENNSGLYVWAADMIIVHELTDDVITRTISDLLATGGFETAFARA